MPFLTQGKTNWKFIAIVAVLAAIVGGGIWFLPGREQEKSIMFEQELTGDIEEKTADWQIYRNKEYGFELDCPGLWHKEGDNIFSSKDPYEREFLKEGVMKAQFQRHSDQSISSVQVYIEKLTERKEENYLGGPIEKDSITYLQTESGLNIVKFSGGAGNLGYVVPIKEDFSEVIYTIVWNPDPLFEKALLTFRFFDEEETVRISDDEAKAIFQATEIVNNNLPDSIEFWTEAYCPGSGTKYDYRFFDIKIYEYIFDSCTEGDFGIHGGCETCQMSKIKLRKSPGDIKHIAIQSLSLDCGEKKFLMEEKTDWSTYSYYETFLKISDRVKVKMEERSWDGGFSSAVDYFTVLDNDKEISGYSVSFFSEPTIIDILNYNNKKYFLIHGGEYGNKGGTSQFFLYVVKENGRVEPVRNSWGGNLNWSCDRFYEFCSLDYAFGYRNNLYLVIGGNVWVFGEDDVFKGRIYASAATFKNNELGFVVSRTKERPAYLGVCSVNIEDSGIPHEIKLPENLEKLNYGELIANEEFCKRISGFWAIFGNYCLFQETCRGKGVVANSPADKAGIFSGDIILEINGNKLIKNKIDEILSKHKPGEELILKVLKDGRIDLIPVRLGIKPEDLDPSFDMPTNIINSTEKRENYETCDIRGMACLAKGTKITMADNSYKNIEDVKKGDFLKSFDVEIWEIKISEVVEVIERTDPIVNVNNRLKAAPDHPIYLADGSIRQAAELKAGDLLFNDITVDSVDYSPAKVDTYDLILKDAVNFFAQGYLVGTPY